MTRDDFRAAMAAAEKSDVGLLSVTLRSGTLAIAEGLNGENALLHFGRGRREEIPLARLINMGAFGLVEAD